MPTTPSSAPESQPIDEAQPGTPVPLSAIEFQPKDCKGGDQPDFTLPVARPFLDCIFHWAPAVPPAVAVTGQVLCRCRLRIFRNGTLGRAVEWAVLITELAQPSAEDQAFLNPATLAKRGLHAAFLVTDRLQNPGVPARACLAEIADQVKAGYLSRAPYEQISWFLHDREQTSRDRPIRHHQIQRVQFNVHATGAKCIYLEFMVTPVAPEELELAAGGLVAL